MDPANLNPIDPVNPQIDIIARLAGEVGDSLNERAETQNHSYWVTVPRQGVEAQNPNGRWVTSLQGISAIPVVGTEDNRNPWFSESPISEMARTINDLVNQQRVTNFFMADAMRAEGFMSLPPVRRFFGDSGVIATRPMQPINEKSIEELVLSLYKDVGKENVYVKLSNLTSPDINEQALKSWLKRLSHMSDFQGSPDKKQALIGNIIKYLELADKDSGFRKLFSAIINDAAVTCGDRVLCR